MAHTHAHPAGHSHGHSHGHSQASGRVLAVSLAATLAFTAFEALAGVLGHSLALLSDAAHNLTDAAALGFSWYALSAAGKPSHQGMTYGYHRVGVLAALVNAVSLVVIAFFIAWEAIVRLKTPEVPTGGLMMGVAGVAIVLNLVIGLWLNRSAEGDINMRSAAIHMLGDAAAALGVVVAGAIVSTTGSPLADPIVSLLIAAFILYSSYDVLREASTVLLEGTPAGTDMPALIASIRAVRGGTRRTRSPCLDGGTRRDRVQLPHPSRRAKRTRRPAGAPRRGSDGRTPFRHHTHHRASRSGRLRSQRHVLHRIEGRARIRLALGFGL